MSYTPTTQEVRIRASRVHVLRDGGRENPYT